MTFKLEPEDRVRAQRSLFHLLNGDVEKVDLRSGGPMVLLLLVETLIATTGCVDKLRADELDPEGYRVMRDLAGDEILARLVSLARSTGGGAAKSISELAKASSTKTSNDYQRLLDAAGMDHFWPILLADVCEGVDELLKRAGLTIDGLAFVLEINGHLVVGGASQDAPVERDEKMIGKMLKRALKHIKNPKVRAHKINAEVDRNK